MMKALVFCSAIYLLMWQIDECTLLKDEAVRNRRSSEGRCDSTSPLGVPVRGAAQTDINFRQNQDGTKYNYNEVIHKSILFYEAQRSGVLPKENRIPWRGDSGLKDGCDVGIDATGGWYSAGDFVKFNFPMALSLTLLAWGGVNFRSAYEDAGELQSMINSVEWGVAYFIKCHVSRYELVGQVGHGKTDHDNWGRPEELSTIRPTYIISATKPGTELAAETSAALAASSLFLNISNPSLSRSALDHAEQLLEFAEKYKGTYHESIPDAAIYYKSFSGYEDELLWASAWLYKSTKNQTYLQKAKAMYENISEQFVAEEHFSWDSKFLGAQALLAEITGEAVYRDAFTLYLNNLKKTPTTRQGMYFLSEHAPNKYAANAAFLSLIGVTLDPPLLAKDSYLQWSEKQIGLLLGDSGRSFVIGFGKNYPKRTHHRSSSCPPYPQKCDWSTYHSKTPNHYILYGGLVGGADKNGVFSDKRDAHQQNQVACNFNAGFQSAVAGLKYFAMQKRKLTDVKTTSSQAATMPTPKPTTASAFEKLRCGTSSPVGRLPMKSGPTVPKFKPNNDKTKYNYNEVLHKSLLFYESQRAGRLPGNNRIPWRGDSALKDGCDVGVDLSGGWYDGGDFVKFGLPMAFSVTTLSWGGILFREAYEDAGELQKLVDGIMWPIRYLIKSHISKYELIGQIAIPEKDHSYWGRPEQLNIHRRSFKVTPSSPGTEVVAETAAALAASSIFLQKYDKSLSVEALRHATELFEFADKYRGSYTYAIPEAADFYGSHSGYHDELLWSALWLYKATSNKTYLEKAIKLYNDTKEEFASEVSFSWDSKFIGAQALLSEITGEESYRTPFSEYLDILGVAATTPEGMYHFSDWAPNRYTGGATFMAVVGATLTPPLPGSGSYLQWAKKQIHLLLGDSGRSYMVGFGENYPLMVHHRASSCPPYPTICDWSTYHSPGPNHYVLFGAVVGGPKKDGTYRDERQAYEGSQVGLDYNAGFQSTVAGLKYISMLEKKGLWKSRESIPKPTANKQLINKLRCAFTSRNGSPVYGGIQTPISFKPNSDGTKYNYNEVLHKSILFYEAQRSGLLKGGRIPWRGDSGLKDGCDIGVDATGGWYDGGDHIKFNFPMAFSLTTLAWGGIEFREAYKDAGEYHYMIDCMKWATEYFIKSHISKYELIAQVGKEKDDHGYWGRAEEMNMSRPTYKITRTKPGTELAAEVAAALAASSLFLNESHRSLSQQALVHAKQIFDLADTYRGSYHFSIPAGYYKSHSGYEDELIWAAVWLYKATKDDSYLKKAEEWYNEVKNMSKQIYSWDYKLVGAQALLAQVTNGDKYRKAISSYLDSLFNATTTPQGLYHVDNQAPNRYTGGAAFMAVIGASLQPPLPKKDEYMKWAEQQIGLLLGDSGMSHVIGFGEKFPLSPHHRSSSCPPYPQKCDWSTYHSSHDNGYILYGALVGGTDENGIYKDDREAYGGSLVGCDYNAGFQSAVAGLKAVSMRKRGTVESAVSPTAIVTTPVSVGSFFFKILQKKPTPPSWKTRTLSVSTKQTEFNRCSHSSPAGYPVLQARQTPIHFKPNEDGTNHNYNEVLHKSILFFEAQRSGSLPSNNRIPWRGDSGLKDGCDIGVDLSGGWYDAGDFVKFGFPMAFSLTTLAWGGIAFRDAYIDAGEHHHMIETIKWAAEYLIKAHTAKYELVGQIGHGKTDHDNWGRPESITVQRQTHKITMDKPGTELAAETAAALAAASIFLEQIYPMLSSKALAHAKELYEFADKHRGLYHESIPDAEKYYKSYSGYDDELIWGAAWLYKATKDKTYLQNATDNYLRIHGKHVVEEQYTWDRKLSGAQALLAQLTGLELYRDPLDRYLTKVLKAKTITEGLHFHSDWGPNRHTAGSALIAIIGATLEPPLPKQQQYLKWAKVQIGLLLGDGHRSYVVGYGKNYPTSPHHRASSCPPYPERCDWSTFNSPNKNHYVLYGALVGGPDENGDFQDKRKVVKQSEVACDYNACFQSAVAGIKHFTMKSRKEVPATTGMATKAPTSRPAISNVTTTAIVMKHKPKRKLVRRVKCKPKDSPRCVKAQKRAGQRG